MAETGSGSDDDSAQWDPMSIQEAARTCNASQMRRALAIAGVSPNIMRDGQPLIVILSSEHHPNQRLGTAALPAEASDPYLQRVIAAGSFANYARLHLDRFTAMLTPKPAPADGPRRSRRRLSPLRRVPPEVLRKIAAFAFHVGYY